MRLLPTLGAVLLIGACGFHPREAGVATFAPSLAMLRVEGAQEVVREAMRNALVVDAGVRITDDPDAPLLQLTSESIQSEVLAITASGTQSDFLLNYSLGYSLQASEGSVWIAPRTIRLQREYTFDRLNVLVSERQDAFLRAAMRRDAVHQILRALSAMRTPTPNAN